MRTGPGRHRVARRVPIFLRKTVLQQLDWYIKCGPLHGYYGTRKQFDARHAELMEWIKRELEVTK